MISVFILLIHLSNPTNNIPKWNWQLIIYIGIVPYDNGSNELKHVRKIFVNRVQTLVFLRYNKTKLRGLSPRTNYTDRAAAAGRRS